MRALIILASALALLGGSGGYVTYQKFAAPKLVEVPSSGSAIPCDKPGAFGLARIVEIDTRGGPKFGEQIKGAKDLLQDKEVVLTFDDGPALGSTEAVLKTLNDQCLRATFFQVGKMANAHPSTARDVFAAEMTVGSHTWSHKNLSRQSFDDAVKEIEKGISAIHLADVPVTPFFRFPELQNTKEEADYLAKRNIAIFSTDIDSRDFTMHRPQLVIDSVMGQLATHGKGIVLLHDLHRNTADALPELLRRLRADGYKIVHVTAKQQEVLSIAKYDQMVFRHH